MRTIYFDGKYLKATDRLIGPFTPGVFKAKGIFETMLGTKGEVLGHGFAFKAFAGRSKDFGH